MSPLAFGAAPGVGWLIGSVVSGQYDLAGLAVGAFVAFTGAWVAFRKLAPERAKIAEEADKVSASAEKIRAEAAQIEETLRLQLIKTVEGQMAQMRETVADAHVAQSDAQAKLAAALAAYAALEAQAMHERHNLKNEIAELGAKNVLLERQVKGLGDELGTLRAQLGLADRRSDERRVRDTEQPED